MAAYRGSHDHDEEVALRETGLRVLEAVRRKRPHGPRQPVDGGLVDQAGVDAPEQHPVGEPHQGAHDGRVVGLVDVVLVEEQPVQRRHGRRHPPGELGPAQVEQPGESRACGGKADGR
jgi:hypothetical protein